MDADTKLICSWMVGDRSANAAHEFMQDLATRLADRVQLTTDGYTIYLNAVEDAFGDDIDYAMLVKNYGETAEAEKRYSPAECIGCERKKPVTGSPDPKHISTHTWSARTSRCGCTCAGSRGSQMHFQQEVGEPHCGGRAPLHVLQLHQDPRYATLHARNGRWRNG